MTTNCAVVHRRIGFTPIACCLLGFFLLACSSNEREPVVAVESAPQGRSNDSDTADVLVESVMKQTVYVPVYSQIYYLDRSYPFYLTATLSIHNTDPEHPIVVTVVRYYDSAGSLVPALLGTTAAASAAIIQTLRREGARQRLMARNLAPSSVYGYA